MSRPSDYVDGSDDVEGGGVDDSGRAGSAGRAASESGADAAGGEGAPSASREGSFDRAESPKLGALGWARWGWRQLTTMRSALVLLLLLAVAAVPGSLVPQRSADPNGVLAYAESSPELAKVLDFFQLFDVYSSVWFSAIYLLLFISLIGCVLPRAKHHWQALRAQPPVTPARLSRLPGHIVAEVPGVSAQEAVQLAARMLREEHYRVREIDGPRPSVSAERGYLRETGNLVFHSALVGVLIAVGLGGSFGYSGQALVVEGKSFVNTLSDFDSFSPGRFFTERDLSPFTLKLDEFQVEYSQAQGSLGQPLDFAAQLTTTVPGGEGAPEGGGAPGEGEVSGAATAASVPAEIKVNHPLHIEGTQVYLLGNGYAPVVTVRDAAGIIVFQDTVPFLPQDANMVSNGVIKVPDGLAEQLGMIGFFYPTQAELRDTGAFTSVYPGLVNPMLTLQVFRGDLGLDDGIPKNVYALDTTGLQGIAGGDSGTPALKLRIGETVELPDGLGSISLDAVKRFASFDIHRDPAQGWVLVFAVFAVAGLLTSLFIPRRRLWVVVREGEQGVRLEYAGLARGEDPGLVDAVRSFADRHQRALP